MIPPNTKFRFLRQTGGGIVYKQNSDRSYHVKTDEGFFIDVSETEIVEVVGDFKIAENIKPKEHKNSFNNQKNIPTNTNHCPVFDLHFDTKNNHVLDIQIANFKLKLAEYKSQNIKTCIFIHGDGDGILRETIRKLLKQTPFVSKYEPANSITYGTGATKVFLK